MINLSGKIQTNGTEFCSDHYQNMTIWKDNYGPSKLGYWLRKHNCYQLSGVPKGRRYCQDYRNIEDSWGDDNLFDCYQKHNVEFSQEYCDKKFSNNKIQLMQCYGTKGVSKGEEFCTSNFNEVTELALLLECYESIPIFTKNYCRLKNENPESDNYAALRKCYTENAKVELNRAFCDDQYLMVKPEDYETPEKGIDAVTKVLDQRYQCYKEIGFMDEKDREYCELIHMNDMTAKYECIDKLVDPKLLIIRDGCDKEIVPDNKCLAKFQT